MKLNYYSDTDSLYIDLSPAESVDSVEISDGVVIDYDSAGKITGIDIEDASKVLDLEECVMSDLPIPKQVAV